MGNTVAGTMQLFNNTFVYLTPVNCSFVGLLQEWVLKLYFTTVLKRRRKVSNHNILKYQINYINWGYTRKTPMGRLRGRGFEKGSARKKIIEIFRALFLWGTFNIIIFECEHDRYNTLNKTYKISTSYLELKAFTVLGDIIRFILIV